MKQKLTLFVILFLAGLFLLAGCGSLPELAPAQDGTPVPTRTPAPTATPDALAEGAAEFVQEAGLAGETVLGLTYDEWISLGISALLVVLGYVIGTALVRRVFPRLVRQTNTALDDQLLQASGGQLRWLVVVVALAIGTNRLEFVSAGVKSVLADVYFFLALFLIVVIAWRLIDLGARQANERATTAGYQEEVKTLIKWLVLALRVVVIIFAIAVALTHFAINVTGFGLILVIIGVGLSLAGRDLMADIVAGAIILIDRPFSVGDRIDLTSIGAAGDVVEIGMRSTRIVTTDNRLVTIPNSQIGKNQVVNYSRPDASYYDMTSFVVAYENDQEQVRQLMADTVRAVEGVLAERGIDVQLRELSENQMLYKAGWWVGSYLDTYSIRDRVNRAVIQALKEAGVLFPYSKGRLNVEVETKEE